SSGPFRTSGSAENSPLYRRPECKRGFAARSRVLAASRTRLFRLAMAGEDARGALHRPAEGLIEVDAADLPALIGFAEEAPVCPPAELLLDPVQRAEECDVAAGILGECTPPLRVDFRQPIE